MEKATRELRKLLSPTGELRTVIFGWVLASFFFRKLWQVLYIW
jgi:hypothetical protein